jgi:hypothetical protein
LEHSRKRACKHLPRCVANGFKKKSMECIIFKKLDAIKNKAQVIGVTLLLRRVPTAGNVMIGTPFANHGRNPHHRYRSRHQFLAVPKTVS